MSEESRDAASDLEALLGGGAPEFTETRLRAFQPWHRPRKHFVRRQQWLREIEFLVRDANLSGQEFRYLTLPGSDLMDIRHLHDDVCMKHDMLLRYLGFNTAMAASRAERGILDANTFSVNRLSNVHHESQVLDTDVREIGREESVSWRTVQSIPDFHAYNLDLCGGFSSDGGDHGWPSYFRALHWILLKQATSPTESLLFITTRIDVRSIKATDAKILSDLVEKVRTECPEYARELEAEWGFDASALPGPLGARLTEEEIFLLGLTQWIIDRAHDLSLVAKPRSVMSYRTGATAGEEDIASIAIRMRPRPRLPEDPSGLSVPVTPLTLVDSRCRNSTLAQTRLRQRTHVDQKLAGDVATFEDCLSESARLMSMCGYDAAAYNEWAREDASARLM